MYAYIFREQRIAKMSFLSASSLTQDSKPPTPLHSLHSGEDVLASYIRSFYPAAPL